MTRALSMSSPCDFGAVRMGAEAEPSPQRMDLMLLTYSVSFVSKVTQAPHTDPSPRRSGEPNVSIT